MIRRIIHIDENKCNGCGICVDACHEGAIGIVNGKAKLLRDDYCDGLGDCLPTCPTNAISFVEREALAYDEEAVKVNMANKKTAHSCPGSMARSITRNKNTNPFEAYEIPTQLTQWPVQIKLAPINAPYFNNSNLLIAADCSAYAYGNFHNKFMKNKITLIGCPKLDMTDYSEKLTEIIKSNEIKSVTVVRMEVPCCGGIEAAVKTALINSGKFIPWNVVTISTSGDIMQ
ncbi:MAG: 4Fe-4S binding protein [Clostridia bacterium]|nr:4Fe-4S binding protein [Clostridia bacterium]